MRRTHSRLVRLTSRPALASLLLILVSLTVACSGQRRPASPARGVGEDTVIQRGVASWYGPRFHGRRTANGERYDMNELTAAHPSLPFGSIVQVQNVHNGRSVVVRINDRGPFAKKRIIDLSFAAAREIGMILPGTTQVELYLLKPAPPLRYTVQVGAFSDADRAVALHRELTRIYPEAVVQEDGPWNRVQVGHFDDRSKAEALRRELAILGMSSSIVVAAR